MNTLPIRGCELSILDPVMDRSRPNGEPRITFRGATAKKASEIKKGSVIEVDGAAVLIAEL